MFLTAPALQGMEAEPPRKKRKVEESQEITQTFEVLGKALNDGDMRTARLITSSMQKKEKKEQEFILSLVYLTTQFIIRFKDTHPTSPIAIEMSRNIDNTYYLPESLKEYVKESEKAENLGALNAYFEFTLSKCPSRIPELSNLHEKFLHRILADTQESYPAYAIIKLLIESANRGSYITRFNYYSKISQKQCKIAVEELNKFLELHEELLQHNTVLQRNFNHLQQFFLLIALVQKNIKVAKMLLDRHVQFSRDTMTSCCNTDSLVHQFDSDTLNFLCKNYTYLVDDILEHAIEYHKDEENNMIEKIMLLAPYSSKINDYILSVLEGILSLLNKILRHKRQNIDKKYRYVIRLRTILDSLLTSNDQLSKQDLSDKISSSRFVELKTLQQELQELQYFNTSNTSKDYLDNITARVKVQVECNISQTDSIDYSSTEEFESENEEEGDE